MLTSVLHLDRRVTRAICIAQKSVEGLEFMHQIHVNTNTAGFVKAKARHLNVKTQVVHRLLGHTLLQRVGYRELVTWMDLYVMQNLYRNTMFDPSFLIVGSMMEVGRMKNKSLSYKTLILRLVQQTQLYKTRAEIMLPLRDYDIFDVTHLKLMK